MQIRPDIYIALDVHDDILIDRFVGRRLDPLTGKIYHIKNFPSENEEVKSRLVTRPDDTEENARSRLQIYKQNVDAILSTYFSILKKLDGNRSKEVVFKEIESLLTQVQKEKSNQEALGLIRQPKYGHLKELHQAIKLCEKALIAADPTVTSLGSQQEVLLPSFNALHITNVKSITCC
ncbi:hypothetical protein POM88_052594 [Heracleum sosnowskyi]|uniref:Adenylate kinase n=1 Tax=Heracleum sosnowskyi TaxID=360622 RepID=A0AAD8GSJ9_9APIA|nr:hypothetical protein POM88_052594 [Heracleum sosnowskyi]